MKTNITVPLFAIIVSIAIGAGSIAFSQKSKKALPDLQEKETVLNNYYYSFTGSPGQEDDETLWQLVTESFFNNSACDAEKNGCVIKTISSSSTAPTHPAFVPVSGSGSAMTPVIDEQNIADARLKNAL